MLEGWRVSEAPGSLAYDPRAAKTPVYRQANVGRLRLLLSEQQWDPPQVTGRWCVRPDDVVLNKLAPVRAAFVSTAAHRHPADGNSLIVRGLPRSAAAWLALCFNHSGYQQLLLIEFGVLKRVGIGSLTSLRIPRAPPEMAALSARLHDLLDELLLAGEAIHRARTSRPRRSRAERHPAALTCVAGPSSTGKPSQAKVGFRRPWRFAPSSLRSQKTSAGFRLGTSHLVATAHDFSMCPLALVRFA